MTGSIDRGGRCDVGGGVCIVSTPHETGTHHGISDLVTKETDYDVRRPPSPSSSSTHSSSSYHTPASSSVSSETGALVVSGCCSESVETSSEFEVSVKEEITSTKVSSDACNKEPVCQTDNTANPPHAEATERKVIQPLLIQLPNTTPVGIDIDMVLPVVSYIQPFSPLRYHIEVGDIIIYINGKSVMDLTHMELCQQLNGRKKTKTSSIDDVNIQRGLTKLVFLPAKYRQLEKETQQRIEQGSDEHQHWQCYPHDKMDVEAVNKGLDVEKVNEDTDEKKPVKNWWRKLMITLALLALQRSNRFNPACLRHHRPLVMKKIVRVSPEQRLHRWRISQSGSSLFKMMKKIEV